MAAVINPAFAGLPTAKVFGKGNYLSFPGEYAIKIENLIYRDIEAGGSALIVEFEVVESNNPKDPVGARRSWFQGKNPSFAGAVLEFLYAVVGVDWKNDEATAEEIKKQAPGLMSEGLEGGFKGQFVRVTTFPKKTKVKKSDFTVHVWTPYVDAAAKVA